jgi:hypothetical protein
MVRHDEEITSLLQRDQSMPAIALFPYEKGSREEELQTRTAFSSFQGATRVGMTTPLSLYDMSLRQSYRMAWNLLLWSLQR